MHENDNYKQVLLDIKTIAERLQFPILFVGAGARIFAFDNQYNIEGRTTFVLRLCCTSFYIAVPIQIKHISGRSGMPVPLIVLLTQFVPQLFEKCYITRLGC